MLGAVSVTYCDEGKRMGLSVWRLWWYFPNVEDLLLLGSFKSRSGLSVLEASDPVLHLKLFSCRVIDEKRVKESGREAERESFSNIPATESLKVDQTHPQDQHRMLINNRGGKDAGNMWRAQNFQWKLPFVEDLQKKLLVWRHRQKNSRTSCCHVLQAYRVTISSETFLQPSLPDEASGWRFRSLPAV